MNERVLFLQGLEIDDSCARQQWLDKACADDPPMRSRLEKLFSAMEQTGGFLETPAIKCLASDEEEDVFSLLDPDPDGTCLGRLGPYPVNRLLGRGGMGVVFQGRDVRLERKVAIKVLAPELAVSRTARQRFLREARAAAAVCHENIVTVFAVEETRRLPFLVMDFIEGESLQARLDEAGPLPIEEVLRIGVQIATGLAAQHKHGLVHRDVKPSNLLLERHSGRVKIADFGLARVAGDASITQNGLLTGTPQYMSPEQAQGQRVDGRSDLFSLGCVLHAMCTGSPPYQGESSLSVLRSICHDPAPRLRRVRPDAPQWLEELIVRLLAKNPADRLASADEIAQQLQRGLAHFRPPRPCLTRRRYVLAAAILVACLVTLGISETTGVTHLASAMLRAISGDDALVEQAEQRSPAPLADLSYEPPAAFAPSLSGEEAASETIADPNSVSQLEKLKIAERELRDSIDKTGGSFTHYALLGLNLANQRRYPEAEAAYRRALELNQSFDTTVLRLHLVGALHGQHKWAEAEIQMRELLKDRPDELQVLSLLAMNLTKQEKLKEADVVYQSILEKDPDDSTFRNRWAIVLRNMGQYEEAEKQLRAAIASNPQDMGSYSTLGMMLESLGKLAEAEQVYREALRVRSVDSLRQRLAGLLKRQGKHDEARSVENGDAAGATSIATTDAP